MIFLPRAEVLVRAAMVATAEADIAWDLTVEQVGLVPKVVRAAGSEVIQGFMNSIAPSPFADKRVRLAAQHAIDRQAIMGSIFGGHGSLVGGNQSPVGTFGFNSGLRDYEYDPDKARELLREAGAEGAMISLISTGVRGPKMGEVGEAVAGFLEAVGFQVEFAPGPWETWLGSYREILGAAMADKGGIGFSVYMLAHDNEGGDGPSRDAGYWQGRWPTDDPELATLGQDAKSASDLDLREELTRAFYARIHDEAHLLVIGAPDHLFGARENVHFEVWPGNILRVRTIQKSPE